MNLQRLWHYVLIHAIQVPAVSWCSELGAPVLTNKLLESETAGEGTISFLQQRATEHINYTPGHGPSPGIVAQHKRNSVLF